MKTIIGPLAVCVALLCGSAADAQVDEFPFTRALIVNSPPEITTWPITSGITSVRFGANGWVTEFDKRLGPNAWPSAIFPGFKGPLQYTLGLCRKLTPQWVCSAVVEFWQRRIEEEGPHSASGPDEISKEWFYDGRWGALAGWQPAIGEEVGVFIMACDGRNLSTMPPGCVPQRANGRLLRWGVDVAGPGRIDPPPPDPPKPDDPPKLDPPTPVDPPHSGLIQADHDQLERIYADLVKRAEAEAAQLAALSVQLANHDTNPSWLKAVFGNRYVQLAMAGFGTYITQRQMANPAPKVTP